MQLFLKESQHDTLTSVGLLIMRVWAGFAMVYAHGWGKLTNFSGRIEGMEGFLGLPGVVNATLVVSAEVFCAALLAIGLGTRVVAIPLVITMGVAAFVAHSGDPFRDRELALFFGTAYLMFIFTGPGKFSLDTLVRSWWTERQNG